MIVTPLLVSGCVVLACGVLAADAVRVSDIKISFAKPFIAPVLRVVPHVRGRLTNTFPFTNIVIGEVPDEAFYPKGADSSQHGPFTNIVAGRVAALNVTWADPQRFMSERQTEELLRELLSSTNTQTWSFHIWSFGDTEPALVAKVKHTDGKEGKWVVWGPPPPGLLWAYQDGRGKWWWGHWNPAFPTPTGFDIIASNKPPLTQRNQMLPASRELSLSKSSGAVITAAVVDSELEERLRARVVLIVLRLRKDFEDYGEFGFLDPNHLRIRHEEPFVEVAVSTSRYSFSFFRTLPDGSTRSATDYDPIFIRIVARLATPPAGSRDGPRYDEYRDDFKNIAPPVEAFREILPGTDVAILVEASSKKAEFIRRMQASLAKLSPPPDSAAGARAALDAFRKSEATALATQLDDLNTARNAAGSLVRLRSEAPVIEALTNANAQIRQALLMALAQDTVGEAAVRPITRLLKDGDSHTRFLATFALGRIKKDPEVAVPALTAAAADEVARVRASALQSLAEFNAPINRMTPVFLKGLADENSDVRWAAIYALGEVCRHTHQEDAKVVPALVTLFHDADRKVRLAAIITTGRFVNAGGGGTLPRRTMGAFAPYAKVIVAGLIPMLSDPDPALREVTAGALANVGPFDPDTDAQMLAALIRAMVDKSGKVRSRAGRGLENFGSAAKDALPVLDRLASSPDQEVSRDAASAAQRIRRAMNQK